MPMPLLPSFSLKYFDFRASCRFLNRACELAFQAGISVHAVGSYFFVHLFLLLMMRSNVYDEILRWKHSG